MKSSKDGRSVLLIIEFEIVSENKKQEIAKFGVIFRLSGKLEISI